MTLTIEQTIEARLEAIESGLAELLKDADQRRQSRDALSELVDDLTPVARAGFDSAVRGLESFEQRGYGEFGSGSLQVLDKVVASFGQDDLEALGDNVVLILETVQEMTQPEIMQMLRSTFAFASEIDEVEEPPGLLNLLGRLRDPAARRGLYRLIFLIESLGTVHQRDIETREEVGS